MELFRTIGIEQRDASQITCSTVKDPAVQTLHDLRELAYGTDERTFVIDREGALVVGMRHFGSPSGPEPGLHRVVIVEAEPELLRCARCMDYMVWCDEVSRALDMIGYLDECRKQRAADGTQDALDLALRGGGSRES